MSERLLILSSCARKTPDFQCRAIDRYLSPEFCAVRRFLRRNPDGNLAVWILSPKYGLMTSGRIIGHYAKAMTSERAAQLEEKISRQFAYLTRDNFSALSIPESVFCHFSEDYLLAFEAQIKILKSLTKVVVANGTSFDRASQLRAWIGEGKDRISKGVKKNEISDEN